MKWTDSSWSLSVFYNFPVNHDYKAKSEYVAKKIIVGLSCNLIYTPVHLLWAFHYSAQTGDTLSGLLTAVSCSATITLRSEESILFSLLCCCRLVLSQVTCKSQDCLWVNNTRLQMVIWTWRSCGKTINGPKEGDSNDLRSTTSDLILLLLWFHHFYQVNEGQPIRTVSWVDPFYQLHRGTWSAGSSLTSLCFASSDSSVIYICQ